MEMLSITDLCSLLSVSESNLRRQIRAGEFPPGFRISPRCLRWRRADVEAWVRQRQESPFRLPSIPDRLRVVNRTGPRARRLVRAA
jgi:predicted DNA-binding transcriptional regulator AlpA